MKPTIVCYMGGTCGDILTAMIDSTDATLTERAVKLTSQRSRLKKPHLFDNDTDKDKYISDIGLVYNSIPSHDLAYHIRRQHEFIGIVVNDRAVAEWAADRFKKLHRPHVWEEMQQHCGADSVKIYAQTMLDFSILVREHTTNLVQLERILAGNADTDLALLGIDCTDKQFYRHWMEKQHNDI
jgi:hypothetical protein